MKTIRRIFWLWVIALMLGASCKLDPPAGATGGTAGLGGAGETASTGGGAKGTASGGGGGTSGGGASGGGAGPNGSACNDGDACTQTDTWQNGICTGGNPVTCVASDQCHVAGTCNPATGQCDSPAAQDGTSCNDGNACTQTDMCQSGVCSGSSPVVCVASDACHVAGTCNPTTGSCDNPNAPDGTPCNDNIACTLVDTCQGGTCSGNCLPSCGAAGGNTCSNDPAACAGYAALSSYDCPVCCAKPTATFKIMTWNIASGSKTKPAAYTLGKIAGLIATENPDVVALQEVQENNPNAGGLNQTVWLAVNAGFAHSKFGAAFNWSCKGGTGRFGVALLSKFYMDGETLTKLNGYTCPTSNGTGYHEPRVLLTVNLHVNSQHTVRVGVTHISPNPTDQPWEMAIVANAYNALGAGKASSNLMGDLNATNPSSIGLIDVWNVGAYGPGNTYQEPMPSSRIDFLLAGASYFTFPPSGVGVHDASGVSDHRAVVANVSLP
jgi:endonuclease/exonuclease/phosphatase family metal-dependent hydrolase